MAEDVSLRCWRDVLYLALGAHAAGGVDPDIFGDDGALLRQLQVLLERRRVADDGGFGLPLSSSVTVTSHTSTAAMQCSPS